MATESDAAPEVVSLGEFAQIVGVSDPTLRKVMATAADFPIAKRGQNGEAYQIPVATGLQWWRDREAAAEKARLERQERIQSLQFEFLGNASALGETVEAGLSPSEQVAQLEAEIKAIRLGRERRELVRATDVEARIAEFLVRVRDLYGSLCDRLRKLCDLDGAAIVALDRLVMRDLTDLADLAEKMRDIEKDASPGVAEN